MTFASVAFPKWILHTYLFLMSQEEWLLMCPKEIQRISHKNYLLHDRVLFHHFVIRPRDHYYSSLLLVSRRLVQTFLFLLIRSRTSLTTLFFSYFFYPYFPSFQKCGFTIPIRFLKLPYKRLVRSQYYEGNKKTKKKVKEKEK